MSLRSGISVVIPVKDTRWAKSRLGLADEPRQRVARGLALSTIRAALASRSVVEAMVVTSDEFVGAAASALGAVVVEEEGVSGLNPAAERGRAEALSLRPHAAVAIVVADLPFLRPVHLSRLAVEFRSRGTALHVADHLGVGTTALIHGPEVRPTIAFGDGSARRHADHGFAPARSSLTGLRTDLDDNDDLVRASTVLSDRMITTLGSGPPRPMSRSGS